MDTVLKDAIIPFNEFFSLKYFLIYVVCLSSLYNFVVIYFKTEYNIVLAL